MRKSFILLIFLLSGFYLPAQYKVRFIVQEMYPPKHDSIYITGYFNNWNPGDIKYMLQPMDAVHRSIVLTLPAGTVEYKFTHGAWPNVEKDNLCNEMQNRRTEIRRDTTVNITVAFWMDECNSENLKKVLQIQHEDTNKVNTLLMLSRMEYDSLISLEYANKALSLSEKINFNKGKGAAYSMIGQQYAAYGKYAEARKFYLIAIKIQEELKDKSELAQSYKNISDTYYAEENYPEWLQNCYTAIKFFEASGNKEGMAFSYSSIGAYYTTIANDSEALKNHLLALHLYEEIGAGNGTFGVGMADRNIADIYSRQGKYKEALERDSISLIIFKELKIKPSIAATLISIGNIYEKQGEQALATGDLENSKHKFAEAVSKYQESLKLNEESEYSNGIAFSYMNLGGINVRLKNISAARIYFEKGLEIYKMINYKSGLLSSYYSLSMLDSIQGNYKQAYNNYKKYIVYRDSLFNEENTKKSLQSKMQYEFDKKETIAKAEQEKKDAETQRIKNTQYLLIASLTILILAVLIIAFIQYRNNRHKQKANILLTHQKEKVETTLTELKSTQAQLIQSEKMASLGELTAGIAHEIQNPLNFVNNFSEVSNELISEMVEEVDKGNTTEVKAIAEDVKQNLEKILHHGKRADAIVKGMLQHSQKSTGQKEPTDINKLADECLRLSYHGLRAKDKTFNAEMKTDFDESLGKINVVPQDISRVLINLLNNAFYAVSEKKNASTSSAGQQYEPMVSISTKKINDKVEIRVRDNGNGIPQKIVDKIFQPFFTTKPTGQGTGLGLSLSYDIIKAHGGEIKVESEEGEGSEFIVQLPVV